MTRIFKYEQKLLRILARDLLPGTAFDRDAALELLREGRRELSQHEVRALYMARLQAGRSPPELREQLRLLVGIVGLHRWARRERAKELQELRHAGELEHWLDDPPIAPSQDVLGAGLRYGLDIATDADKQLIEARLGQKLRRSDMPPPPPDTVKYIFDPRSRPPNLDVAKFETFVKNELQNSVKDLHESLTKFVLGALSLDGMLPDGPLGPEVKSSLVPRIVQLRFESEGTTKGLDAGTEITNRHAYRLIHQEIEAIRLGVNGGSPSTAYYEELAFVSRELLSNATEVPIDAPGLRDRVRIALSEYVPGEAGGTLQLPSLSAPTPAGAELLSDNIRAVALIYAAWNLEEMKLFQVLDRSVEVFMNGQLPVGFDNGGRALSEYYFDDDDQRLTEAARRMTYSRVLGVPGGEVSREAPPNRAFNDLFLRFMATVAEFDRQRRIDDIILNAQRADVLSNTGEQVRKAGFDLAANASLYGYGGTFFVAKRMARQTERALRILSVPEILSAYGVHSAFQVVERVCATDLGGKVPNVARLKTMAEAGKAILDIVARHTVAWQGGSGRPLFDDPVSSGNGYPEYDGGRQPDIPRFERDELIRNVDHWLAVNGIKDEQRSRLGEPEVSSPVASIPTVGGDASGSAAFDQLRQMVSAGQTPSLDQLKALLPDVGGMVRM